MNLARKLFSWAARFYFSMLFPGVGVTDWTTGWRLYTYDFLKRYSEAYPFLFCSQGFVAQTEILLRALSLRPRVRVAEVGAVVRYDLKKGKSKMRIFRTAWEYLRLGLRIKWSSLRKGGQFCLV